jgi:hypothetical protein
MVFSLSCHHSTTEGVAKQDIFLRISHVQAVWQIRIFMIDNGFRFRCGASGAKGQDCGISRFGE